MALVDKVALITGAASGIGLATATIFLQEGIKKITLLDIKESPDVQKLREKFPDSNIYYADVDVTVEEQVRDVFKMSLAKFKHLDIVVHSAGIFDERNYTRMVQVNVVGSMHVNLLAMEMMGIDKGGKGGMIINISSESALAMYPATSLYATTKMSLMHLSRNLGTDFYFSSTGVKVIAICPGATATNMLDSIAKNDKLVNIDCIQEVSSILTSIPMQSPENVGKCVLQVALNGENGSIWWCKDDLPGQKMRILVSEEGKESTQQLRDL